MSLFILEIFFIMQSVYYIKNVYHSSSSFVKQALIQYCVYLFVPWGCKAKKKKTTAYCLKNHSHPTTNGCGVGSQENASTGPQSSGWGWL